MTGYGLADEFFSSTFQEASSKFIQACRYKNYCEQTFEHPLSGPLGEKLYTSAVLIGPHDADHHLLIISGTHGIEGYAGSGIMTGAISEGVFDALPSNMAVMLIHLINPWGCAWGHRHTENNADLFRDALYYKPSLYCDDSQFDERYKVALTPASWQGTGKAKSDALLKALISEQGLDQVIRVARMGQHKYPDTQCYNGDGNGWSTQLYRQLSERYLNQAKQIFCLDIHTGFGEYGKGLFIPYYGNSEKHLRKLRRLEAIVGKDHIYQAGFDPSIPPHPRAPWETIEDFMPEVEMTCTGLEFGTFTYDIDTAIDINRYMNYLLVHGDLSKPDNIELYQQYQQLYYPQEAEWKNSIYSVGISAIKQILNWQKSQVEQ